MKECFYVKGQECTCGECIQHRKFMKGGPYQCPDFEPKGGNNDDS